MNIDYPFRFDEFKRFAVKIPILGFNGRCEGLVQFYVMAKNARQARAHARKEMLKIARISTNKAEVIDTEPNKERP